MSRNTLWIVVSMAGLLGTPGLGWTQAKTKAPAAARPAQAAPQRSVEWLSNPDREGPSPTIFAKTGVGTANAVAEARVSAQRLRAHCTEEAQYYTSVDECVRQMQPEYGNKVFRATADCTIGRITTSGEQTYTLDGLWDNTDIGGGRTRWRDAEGNVAERDLINNGLHVSDQWETLCPAPVSAALIARAARARAVAAAPPASAAGQGAPARPTARVNPSVCGGEPLCTEVNSFAVTITDFRASLAQPTKVLTITARFQNKGERPLILGYVPGSGVATDERTNRYAINEADIRGIGVISSRAVDTKFVLEPGVSSDARFTYVWGAGREIYGTTFDVELTVREIMPLPNGQVTLGSEHPLRIEGLIHGARPGGTPVSRDVRPEPAVPAAPVNPAAPPDRAPAPPQVNHCAESKQPCFDAGPFSITVTGVNGTVISRRHHNVRFNLTFTNHTNQQLILAYKSRTNSAIDNLGNGYAFGRPNFDGSVQGIGMVDGRTSDTQFRLAPGASRSAIFGVIRFENGPNVQGISYTFSTVIAELRLLQNGQQSETVREFSVNFPDLPLGRGAGETNVSPAGTGSGTSGQELKKAGEALRDLFKKKKR